MNIPLNIDPTDCETCGLSYDELTVDLNDDGTWDGTLVVGCHGGSSIHDATRPEIIAWLRDECSRVTDPDVLNRHVRALENA